MRNFKLKKLSLCLWVPLLFSSLFILSCWKRDQEQVIRVALINSLTGSSLDFGRDARNGVLLALHELEEQERRRPYRVRYEVIEFDDQSRTETIPKIMAEVKARKVDFALGPLTSGRGLKAIELLGESKVLLIGPALASSSLRKIADHFVTLSPCGQDVARQLGTTLRYLFPQNTPKVTQLAVYSDVGNLAYAQEFATAFVGELGGRMEQLAFNALFDRKDVPLHHEFLKRLRQSSATHLLVIASAMDAAIIAQLAKQVRPKLQLYFSSWSITDDFFAGGGHAIEGALFAAPLAPASPTPLYEKFLKNYQTQFHTAPGLSVAQFYFEAMLLIDHLIGPSRHWDGSQIDTLLAQGVSFQGLFSQIHINRTGDAVRDIGVYTIEQGAIRPLR